MKITAQKYYFALITTFLIVVVFLATNTSDNVTAAVVSVEDNGISNVLIKSQAGKLQTHVYLKQPFLLKLKTAEGSKIAAQEVSESIDFSKPIVNMYVESSPAPLIGDFYGKVIAIAPSENNNFKEDTTCFKKIGESKSSSGELEMAILSELKFTKCASTEKSVGYMKHTFYNLENHNFLCSQDSPGLLTANLKTGDIVSGVSC